jgi:hypothetical protein
MRLAFAVTLHLSTVSLPSRADTNIINSTKTEPRIVGERKAAPDEFPYQVRKCSTIIRNFICKVVHFS